MNNTDEEQKMIVSPSEEKGDTSGTDGMAGI
jgi:hypothetical protein